MEKYTVAEMEVIRFNAADVITTSTAETSSEAGELPPIDINPEP